MAQILLLAFLCIGLISIVLLTLYGFWEQYQRLDNVEKGDKNGKDN
jgi:hypothetical protein